MVDSEVGGHLQPLSPCWSNNLGQSLVHHLAVGHLQASLKMSRGAPSRHHVDQIDLPGRGHTTYLALVPWKVLGLGQSGNRWCLTSSIGDPNCVAIINQVVDLISRAQEMHIAFPHLVPSHRNAIAQVVPRKCREAEPRRYRIIIPVSPAQSPACIIIPVSPALLPALDEFWHQEVPCWYLIVRYGIEPYPIDCMHFSVLRIILSLMMFRRKEVKGKKERMEVLAILKYSNLKM